MTKDQIINTLSTLNVFLSIALVFSVFLHRILSAIEKRYDKENK